jgi:peroxiredoxin
VRVQRISILVFVLCFVAFHVYIKRVTQPNFSAQAMKKGDHFQAFTAPTLQHGTLDLAALAKTKRLIVLNFWESWCGPCKIELPDLEKLYLAHQAQGLQLVGIFGTSAEAAVLQLVRSNGLTYPMVFDTKQAIGAAAGVQAVPTTFVLDPNLRVLRYAEGIDTGLDDFIRSELAKPAGNGK